MLQIPTIKTFLPLSIAVVTSVVTAHCAIAVSIFGINNNEKNKLKRNDH